MHAACIRLQQCLHESAPLLTEEGPDTGLKCNCKLYRCCDATCGSQQHMKAFAGRAVLFCITFRVLHTVQWSTCGRAWSRLTKDNDSTRHKVGVINISSNHQRSCSLGFKRPHKPLQPLPPVKSTREKKPQVLLDWSMSVLLLCPCCPFKRMAHVIMCVSNL